MHFNADNSQSARALRPFTAGGARVLLVPHKGAGAAPAILLIARHQAARFSRRLTVAEARGLAAYFGAAADEAETLGRRTLARSGRHGSHG